MVESSTVPMAEYHKFDPAANQERTLLLDCQAISSLQLLEVEGSTKNKKQGSLFDFVDRCKTSFGRRLLKKWICSPMADISQINDRLDAVEDLITAPDAVRGFQNKSWKLPDFEKLLSSIYQYAMRNQSSMISFENIPALKLKEFYFLLD